MIWIDTLHIGKVISAANSIERAGAGAISKQDNNWTAPTIYAFLKEANGIIAVLTIKLKRDKITRNILNLLIFAAHTPNKIADIGDAGLFKIL